ncbi:NAD(P)H-binding protein [Streptomyces sp. 8N706]|uniref:NAD(P)H-binding protein n=1 Tax=Streptomyces sp. 8N706 TaxID=3457416 RepID=UPI003FD67FDD
MTTLVTGSRGRVGRALLELLHSQGLEARAASKAPEELDLPDGIPSVRCDLTEPDTFPAALEGVTSVFLYAEASRLDTFLEEAARAGVRQIVLLSSSSVLTPDAETHAIARLHVDAEKALEASPIASTFLRPGHFATNALQWSRAVKSTGAVSLPYPHAYTDPIHEADIADVALEALKDPRPDGTAWTLTGPESLTFQDQIDHLARVTGRPVTVNAVSRDAWKKEAAAYVPEAFADVLLDVWESTDGSPVELTRTVEEVTGHPARSFATWAEDHADDFRP